jgi:hypothetical protein
MRITDNKNIREPLDNDYGRVIICDTDSIVDFVKEFYERTKKGEWVGTGNMHYFIVTTSELSCKLASECDENNIFETTYEVWYDQDAKSDEMTDILTCLSHMRNMKIIYNSIIGSGILSTSARQNLYDYNKSKDDFREHLFTYMEKRNDMFNRNSVTAIQV